LDDKKDVSLSEVLIISSVKQLAAELLDPDVRSGSFFNNGSSTGSAKDCLTEQQQIIDEWLVQYHTFRPHQSLGYLAPQAFYEKLVA